MSRYVRKNSKVIYLPGHGQIKDDRVIEGNYDKYVPSVLVKLPDFVPESLPVDQEAVTEVFKVPKLRDKVAVVPEPVSVPEVAPLPLAALVVSLSEIPPQVEDVKTEVKEAEAKEHQESEDQVVSDNEASAMTTKEQAAAVVAKLKKPRR